MLEFSVLLLIGFVVGLGGAVILGLLLTFVIFDTIRKRMVTDHFIIVGHVLREASIVFLILFGLNSIML